MRSVDASIPPEELLLRGFREEDVVQGEISREASAWAGIEQLSVRRAAYLNHPEKLIVPGFPIVGITCGARLPRPFIPPGESRKMLYFSTMDQPIPEDEAHALIIVEAREDGRKARMKSKQKHAASEALAECFSILLPSEGASD